MSTDPIRVGFIGLNATASWATNSHLPYLKGSTKYKIVALLNSSEEKARSAIKAHGLPSETRAYGTPAEFAADENIDMVVCSVRVDKHYPVLKPILESSKIRAVHCEWPLGKNLAEAEELASLAESRGIKTVIGLQGRQAPAVHKIREIISSGKIGKVLSVTITAVGWNFGAEELDSLAYAHDIETGGNMVTIHFSHIFDTVTQTLGQLASYSCILETKRSSTILRDQPHTYRQQSLEDKPARVVGTVPRTSHDQILLQGHLKDSGALISFHIRGGLNFPGDPGLIWSIYGETGELKLTTPPMNLHFGGPGHELWYHDQSLDEAEQIELPRDEFDEMELPPPARNPARVYEAFADSKTEGYADWPAALKRHRLVEELYERAKAGAAEEPAKYDE